MKTNNVQEALQDWLVDAKIPLLAPPTHTLMRLYGGWKRFLDADTLPEGVSLSDELEPNQYGRIRIGSARPYKIELNNHPSIPKRRRALALVHELLHDYYGKRQPDHLSLHHMAMGLHSTIFPRLARDGANVIPTVPTLHKQMPNEFLNDLLDGDDDDETAVIGDQVLSLRLGKKKKKRAPAPAKATFTPRPTTARNPGLKKYGSAGSLPPGFAEGAAKIMSRYKGWVMPALLQAYARNTQLVPLRGVSQVQPLSNDQGWRAPSLESWFEGVRTMIESYTATARSAKAAFTFAALGSGAPSAAQTILNPANLNWSGQAANLTQTVTNGGTNELFQTLITGAYQLAASNGFTPVTNWSATSTTWRTLGWYFRVTAPRERLSSAVITLRFNTSSILGNGATGIALPAAYRRDFRVQLDFSRSMSADFLFVLGDQDRGMNVPIGLDNTAFNSVGDNGPTNATQNSPFDIVNAPSGMRFDVETVNYRDIVI